MIIRHPNIKVIFKTYTTLKIPSSGSMVHLKLIDKIHPFNFAAISCVAIFRGGFLIFNDREHFSYSICKKTSTYTSHLIRIEYQQKNKYHNIKR